jgi:hypothetical protein
MTARTRAPAFLPAAVTVTALLAVAAVALALRAPAAAADIGPGSGGTNAGGSYSAWAWYTAAGGRDPVDTPDECTLEFPEAQHLVAHMEYEIDETSVPGTYNLSYGCAADLFDSRTANSVGGFNDWEVYDNRWTISVTPAPIDDLVAQALARLDPNPPAIATDLRPGVDGLVHVPVQFQLTGNLGPQGGEAASAGPITVVLTAWPDDGVPIDWHTGDGRTPCDPADGRWACTHDYARSSYRQHHEGLPNHHYRVTAGITYTGRYAVYNGSAPIAGADIGNVGRTVELGLAVDEAQAVNTRR